MGEVKEKIQGASSREGVYNPTKEELKHYCNQLLMQRNQLAEKLDNVTSVLNTIPWLFEVVKNPSAFSAPFVQRCADEIEVILSPVDNKESKESEKE